MKPSRLAVDTNVLLDLADEVHDVIDAVSWLLNQRDLTAPVIATPREIVRKFFR